MTINENSKPVKPVILGLFAGQIQMGEAFNKPLCDFLNGLPEQPENSGLSRDEIQHAIQQERQSWEK